MNNIYKSKDKLFFSTISIMLVVLFLYKKVENYFKRQAGNINYYKVLRTS